MTIACIFPLLRGSNDDAELAGASATAIVRLGWMHDVSFSTPGMHEFSKAMFLDEVRRLEDELLAELQRGRVPQAARPTGGDASSPSDGTHSASGSSARTVVGVFEAQSHLEQHKDSVQLGAMAAVARHREHLMALRQVEERRS